MMLVRVKKKSLINLVILLFFYGKGDSGNGLRQCVTSSLFPGILECGVYFRCL